MADNYINAVGLQAIKTWAQTSFAASADIPTAVSDLTNDSGYQTAAQVQTAINNSLASVYTYKGSVATYGDLPSTGVTAGDVYDVQADGQNYAWTGSAWDSLGVTFNASDYWAKTELTAMTVSDINTILNA